MTQQLYSTDCYMRQFDAKVISIGENGREIELDKTAFYPTSGGQPDDTGLLSIGSKDYIVSSVKKDKGRILHHVDREGLVEGDEVQGQIDWTRRFYHMRYHTASHVLSGVIWKETGAEITGNQIDIERTRIDFNLENFDKEKIKQYEEKANKIFKSSHPVHIRFISKEEAMEIPNVTKLAKGLPDTVKEIRMVSVEGVEQEACGGTHLANTKEVGQIEIIGTENKGKANRRIYFVLKDEEE